MRIVTDLDKCCGNGICVIDAPEVFDQNDDDGTVVVLTSEPAAELHEAVRAAARHCPTEAITVLEDKS